MRALEPEEIGRLLRDMARMVAGTRHWRPSG
jgi:hypothetical protein